MNYQFLKPVRMKRLCLCLLFVIGISLSSCSRYSTSEESATYLDSPKEGDLYFIEQEKDVFSLMEIKSLSEESIDFLIYKGKTKLNQYVDESYGVVKFVRTEESKNYGGFWADSTITYRKDEIKKLYKDNTIYEIKRY